MARAIRSLSLAAIIAVVAMVVASASDASAAGYGRRGKSGGSYNYVYTTQVIPVVRVYQPVVQPVYSTQVYPYLYPTGNLVLVPFPY